MGNLGDMVSELEEDHEALRQECRDLERQLDEVEGQLELANDEVNKLKEFKDWVGLAYPEIIKDYGCVKIIEERAHEHG